MSVKPVKNKGNEKKDTRRSTGRIYFAIMTTVLIIILAVQVINLYNKNKQYAITEAARQEELNALNEESEELTHYEEYTKSKEYKESVAKKKLGLVYENEIIFREK